MTSIWRRESGCPRRLNASGRGPAHMTRWEALVRFDDEIRDAAAKLLPFGSVWVEELGKAFFALHEDRKYLPNIVARLTEEAEVAALEAEKAAARQWLVTFSEIGQDEKTRKEAFAVLIELKARGYSMRKEGRGIGLTRAGGGTSYVYSNADILRYGKMVLRNARERNATAKDTTRPLPLLRERRRHTGLMVRVVVPISVF